MSIPMIFPLPLEPFEEHMLGDDHPAYPANVFARLYFRGRLDRQRLERAFRAGLPGHPLLAATVRPSRRGRLEWIDASHMANGIRWDEPASQGETATIPGIDLRQEPGLRIWVREAAEGTVLVTQAHHACCDGIGAIQALTDLLLGYAADAEGAGRRARRPLDVELLRRRGAFGLSFWQRLAIVRQHLYLVRGVFLTVRHQPVPLVPTPPQFDAASPAEGFPACCLGALDSDESHALMAATRRLGATLDELLVRDLHLALGDWQREHVPQLVPAWRRIWTPINLRTIAHRRLSAANMIGTAFLDRHDDHLSNPSQLLEGIRREMHTIRTRKVGYLLPFAMHVVRKLTGNLGLFAPTDRCTATCLLTNLGAPFARLAAPGSQGTVVLDGAALTRLELLGPLRPYTQADFNVYEYARRTWISLHFDPRSLTRAQAEDLLAKFLSRLRQSSDATHSSPSEFRSC